MQLRGEGTTPATSGFRRDGGGCGLTATQDQTRGMLYIVVSWQPQQEEVKKTE